MVGCLPYITMPTIEQRQGTRHNEFIANLNAFSFLKLVIPSMPQFIQGY